LLVFNFVLRHIVSIIIDAPETMGINRLSSRLTGVTKIRWGIFATIKEKLDITKMLRLLPNDREGK